MREKFKTRSIYLYFISIVKLQKLKLEFEFGYFSRDKNFSNNLRNDALGHVVY